MPKTPHLPTEESARLLAALDAVDTLSCELAEAWLPALVEAEFAGEAVDQNPDFAQVLRHIDHCPTCLTLYEQISTDLEAVVGVAEVLPRTPMPTVPVLAPPVAKGEHILLQVVDKAVRRFMLMVTLPRLTPSVATLSGPQRSLFADRLPELAGAPLLAVNVGRDAQALWMQIAIRDLSQASPWRVDLSAGDQTLSATTDARGLVRFTLPPDTDIQQVQLNCVALPADPST